MADAVFRPVDSIRKVALFMRAFIVCGCQKLQLNSLNVIQLFDAREHPEPYHNLTVRV
ncbi:MAG: glycine radical domain-containing protein [Bacteroidota bacterium]